MGAIKARPGDKGEVEVGEEEEEEEEELSCRPSLAVRMALKWALKQDQSQGRREKGVVGVKWETRTRVT